MKRKHTFPQPMNREQHKYFFFCNEHGGMQKAPQTSDQKMSYESAEWPGLMSSNVIWSGAR